MAAPSPGKCSLLLILVLVLYTGCAFRIRDGPGPSPVEHRSSLCGSAKCAGDESPSTGSLPSVRRRFDAHELPRGRTLARDDDDKSAKTHPSLGHDKSPWESKKIRFGRFDVKTEQDTSHDDDDDDGVEVTSDDEESQEESDSVVNADDDDDEDDDDDDKLDDDEEDDENSNNEDDIDDNGSDADDEDLLSKEDENDDEDDDDESKQDDLEVEDKSDEDDEEKSYRRVKSETISSLKVAKDKWDKIESSSPKIKVTRVKEEEEEEEEEAEDSDDEEMDSKEENSLKENKQVKESKKDRINVEGKSKKAIAKDDDEEKKAREGEEKDNLRERKQLKESKKDTIKVEGKSKKAMVKEHEEKSDDEDDDDDDEDDVKEKEKVTPVPIRKLEKVRVADKEKAKSTETIAAAKPAVLEPEKSTRTKESPKMIEETRARKRKSPEEGTKATKLEIEKSGPASPTKRETTVKTDDTQKPTKKTTPSVKTEVPRKSTPEKVEVKKKVEKDDRAVVSKNKDDVSTSEQRVMKKSEKPSAKPVTEVKKTSEIKVTKDDGKGKKSISSSKKTLDSTTTLTQLNDAILRVPTFVPNFTAIQDPVCQQHGKIFLRQLRGYKLWALQMLDSSAKIPPGLLRGNVNQFGDFDQCLGIIARVKVDEKTVKVQGKYCLATLDIHASIPDMRVPVNFIQSRGFIRASMRDPGHFIPRFTTANWAVCIPAACSSQDAKTAIESALSHMDVASGLKIGIEVEPEMCYVRQKSQSYTKETIGVLYFYAMIICIVLIATIRDYFVSQEGKGSYSERIIMSFSLRRTARILTKDENKSAGEISCIHGIRSLATIALYVAHKMIPTAQMPYANRISLTEIANNPISSLLRTSLAYTDCFLLLSGLLTAFNMARESAKRGEIRWFCRLVARFIRLTPALVVVVFWYAYVMEHTGSGPQWNRVVVSNAELCKQNSWTNLLYIQNFFPFEEMCATHTHQLALDMQLSLIAPILVFFLTLKPIIGVLVIFFILQVSATIRYFATTNNNLSLVIFHGMTLRQLYRTANLTYALPLHRATPYVFGVGLGVLLHWTGKNVRIFKIFVLFGWLVAIALGSWTLFSPWQMARRDYVYDVEEAAHYAVIAPVTWSFALCWIIFACHTDHGGIVNKFLSSYWMVLFSRISYAVYLCQFTIFFYNVGTTRYTSEIQLHKFIDPYEALAVTLVSVVLTLLIDIPMQEVKNVIMESTDGLASRAIVESESATDENEAPVEESSREEARRISAPEAIPDGESGKEEPRKRRGDVESDPGRLDELPRDEYEEKWRPRLKSNGRVYERSYEEDRYEDDDEEYDQDEEEDDEEENYEEEDDDERPTEWSWVKKSRGRMSPDEDGLAERRRSRSGQRSYVEPEIRRYDQEEDRRERRSASRQLESPRSSAKRRERSASRGEDSQVRRAESRGSRDRSVTPSRRRDRSLSRSFREEDPPRRYSRSESRAREQERAPSRDRHERSPSREPPPPRVRVPRLVSSGSEDEPRSPVRSPGSENKPRSSIRSLGSEDEPRSSIRSLGSEDEPRSSIRSLGSEDEPRSSIRSSGSEEEPRSPARSSGKRAVEPRISDEEDWEQELRIRRQKFKERLASEDRETRSEEAANEGSWNSVRRRSSAEGKIALLQDPTTGSNVMDSWTVSRGPRVSLLGSSQETEDDVSAGRGPVQRESSLREEEKSEEESSRRRSYTSGSQVTSLEDEDEEETSGGDFVLSKDSRRVTVVDLSKLSPEGSQEEPGEGTSRSADDEEQKPILATLKLFKRESIVKSQASEEDTEYLLPERPKLQEQEQDHPFKQAWQLQKSRSEEDPMPYALKDVKNPQQETSRTKASDGNDEKTEES